MSNNRFIIDRNDPILITGANGFIGSRVVQVLLGYGFKHIRCFVRPSSNRAALNKVLESRDGARVDFVVGNLLNPEDARKASENVRVVFHLAAGVEKSFPGCFLNSVITTRNLLEAVRENKSFRRFLNVSSIAVYSGLDKRRGDLIDENSGIERNSHLRFEAYTYGKIKQDEIVIEYNDKYNIPFVIVRPGVVYGPGKRQILGRVGIDTFGIFLHIGGSNVLPLTYVDNCAEAIVLAGLTKGIDGEVFNIVDDDLPTCREFLKMYKKEGVHFRSVYFPYRLFYLFCFLWEKYSHWSKGQLPPVFNRMRCQAHWKGHRYTNKKLKEMVGWKPSVTFEEATRIFFEHVKSGAK